MRRITLKNTDFADFVQHAMKRGARIPVVARGNSMWPIINDGDTVHIRPAHAHTVNAGDLVFYRRASGAAVLHQVTGLYKNHLIVSSTMPSAIKELVNFRNCFARVMHVSRKNMLIKAATKLPGFAKNVLRWFNIF